MREQLAALSECGSTTSSRIASSRPLSFLLWSSDSGAGVRSARLTLLRIQARLSNSNMPMASSQRWASSGEKIMTSSRSSLMAAKAASCYPTSKLAAYRWSRIGIAPTDQPPLPFPHWGLMENMNNFLRDPANAALACDGVAGRQSTVIEDFIAAVPADSQWKPVVY